MKYILNVLIMLIPLIGLTQQTELGKILDGIENAQLKIENFNASFNIFPLLKEREEYSTLTVAGDYKIEGDWLWTRNKVKAKIRRYFYDTSCLKRANYSLPYTTQYYAFNGRESLRFDEEYLEKGIQGYLIAERDAYDMACSILTPNRLWFNTLVRPTFLLIDIFKKRFSQFAINTVKYEGEDVIDGNLCKIIYCEYKFMVNPAGGDYATDYLKIWVDPKYNYIFRKIETGTLIPFPLTAPPDYQITDEIKIKEIMPGFYLPVSGRYVFYKKENGQFKPYNAQRVEVNYKGINLPLTEDDFWFPMRKDRLIFNSLMGVWGRNWEEYQKKLAEFNKQF